MRDGRWHVSFFKGERCARLMMTWTSLAALVTVCAASDPPPVLDALIERVAFGSCHHQRKDSPALIAAAESAPDLFIFLGDNGI